LRILEDYRILVGPGSDIADVSKVLEHFREKYNILQNELKSELIKFGKPGIVKID
jgi:hypothetical protein